MSHTTLICNAKRSAIGAFQGTLASLDAPQIASQVIRASLAETNFDPAFVNEVYMGCVLTAGMGQAPARQAALGAGLEASTPCTTVGKVCGSGLKSVMLGDLTIRSGEAECVLAGGMESMSRAPFLLPKIREGLRMGHGELVDSMIKDGLWDVYNNFHMGNATEMCVREYKITREAQDTYAKTSYERALKALASGAFKNEIVPVEVKSKKGAIHFENDEEPARADLSKFGQLKASFEKEGTITAANASSLSDGAACMILCSEHFAHKHKLKPMARIVAQAQAAQDPAWFSTAPAASIKILLQKAKVKSADVDLWEINEAFAAVALANLKLLDLNPEKVNVHGGAIALGHPIGASGARILTTLCHALHLHKKRLGVASLCIGGGEATSLLIEALS